VAGVVHNELRTTVGHATGDTSPHNGLGHQYYFRGKELTHEPFYV